MHSTTKATTVYKGVVAHFSDTKGFGFIQSQCSVCGHLGRRKRGFCAKCGDRADDVFVHFTAIVSDSERRGLGAGQIVSYELTESSKGVRATNVRVIGERA